MSFGFNLQIWYFWEDPRLHSFIWLKVRHDFEQDARGISQSSATGSDSGSSEESAGVMIATSGFSSTIS